jgi:hypothetical protein
MIKFYFTKKWTLAEGILQSCMNRTFETKGKQALGEGEKTGCEKIWTCF